MLPRVLEPEFMDSQVDARDYDAMDHSAVNQIFADDFLDFCPQYRGVILDVGTGTALIPVEICCRAPNASLLAVDAAGEMLLAAQANLDRTGLSDRVTLAKVNARHLPYPDGAFPAVISNSLIHHIPEPFLVLSELARVCAVGGAVFVRDLLRPPDEVELSRLVELHAGDANENQRAMFADSLRAALTLAEVRTLVGRLDFVADTVRQTSDRHWTWAATR